MADTKRMFRAVIGGLAGGMAAAWAINRFFDLAARSTRADSLVPYVVGAGLGATYATYVHRRDVPLVARVPLGAAIWLGEPEKTAAPPKGGRDMKERAQNIGLRMASRGLKRMAEKVLFA